MRGAWRIAALEKRRRTSSQQLAGEARRAGRAFAREICLGAVAEIASARAARNEMALIICR